MEYIKDKVGKQEFQELSEVAIFNVIGEYAKTQGYEPIFFKTGIPGFDDMLGKFTIRDMHYIHLYKNKEMQLSIYYDKFNIGAWFPENGYYELYDLDDIARFGTSAEEEIELYDRVRLLIGSV